MPEDNLEKETPVTPEETVDVTHEGETETYKLPDSEDIPEKFRGKEPEEVVKSYVELEKMIERKAQEMTKAELEKRGLSLTEEKKKEIKDVTDDIDFSKLDFTKMSPEDFAKWILSEVDKRSAEKARTIITESTQTREAVAQEIAEAKKKHPRLEDDEPYKDAVLAHIASAKAQGKDMSLEEACQKVDALIGETTTEETPANKVKRAGVETSTTNDVNKNLSEDEKVLEGIKNAGQSNTGPLGGLGI